LRLQIYAERYIVTTLLFVCLSVRLSAVCSTLILCLNG